MKKILIPIALATAVTPIIATTSCNANHAKELDLNKLWHHDSFYRAYTEKACNFVENQKYVANINVGKFLPQTPSGDTIFTLIKYPTLMDDQTSTPICKPYVWVDNKKLVQVTKDSQKALNTFWLDIDLEESKWYISIYEGTIQKSSIVKIEFEVDKAVEDYYPSLLMII